MENATKALLIAASVLIVIVLIALGVNLLASVGDTTDQAEKIGQQLENGIEGEADKLTGMMTNTMSATEIQVIMKNEPGGWYGPDDGEWYGNMQSMYGDYRFRIYIHNKVESIYFSEKVWNNAKVYNTVPSGYRLYRLTYHEASKRAIWICVPR